MKREKVLERLHRKLPNPQSQMCLKQSLTAAKHLSPLIHKWGAYKKICLLLGTISGRSQRELKKWKIRSAAWNIVSPLRKDLGKVTHDVSYLLNKADDLENRLRRNNLRLLGFTEKLEGTNAAVFFGQWLIDKFGKDSV